MEQFAMTDDGAALLLGIILVPVILGIVSIWIEDAWRRAWDRLKRLKRRGVGA